MLCWTQEGPFELGVRALEACKGPTVGQLGIRNHTCAHMIHSPPDNEDTNACLAN